LETVVHQVRAFAQLDWRERFFLVEALAVVALVRLGLSLLSFKRLRALVRESGRRSVGPHRAGALPVDRIAWAVQAVSRFVPGATCLTQALSGQVLLARRGYRTRLHIGVAKSSRDQLAAHAWLECDGRVVLGDHGFLTIYSSFPTLE
jgi:hypothetical protein